MNSRIIISIFILAIIISINADGVQPEGMGTELEPYLVDTLDNLLWLSTNPDGWDSYYLQTSDIDASETATWNEGAGFNPIGWCISSEEYDPFEGSYNGSYFSISGLYIDRPELDGCGLFGFKNQGTLEGIRLIDARVTGADYTGSLVGYFNNATAADCGVEGEVSGGSSTGVLVGFCHASVLQDCYGKGIVTGVEYTGGLVGEVSISVISRCYADVGVKAEIRVGGFAGYNYDSVIADCYAVGVVAGIELVGGLVGDNCQSQIFNTYASGNVSGESAVGGLAGGNNSEIHSSIWDLESSGQTEGIGNNEGGEVIDLLGKTTLEMQDILTYTELGWDFAGEAINGVEDIWNIADDLNGGFGYLTDLEWTLIESGIFAWFTAFPLEVFIGEEIRFVDLSFGDIAVWEWDFNNDGNIDSGEENPVWSYNESGNYDVSLTVYDGNRESDNITRESYIYVIYEGIMPAGSGTETDPFQIAILDNLLWLSTHPDYWDCHFIQTADIDASETENWNDGAGFDPIGNFDYGGFCGRYNGNNHVIDGLYINRPESTTVGMFGYCSGGIVENLGLTNIDFTGDWCVGSFIAQVHSESELNNCYATGSITGEVEVGGLAGHGLVQAESNSFYNYEEVLINGEHHYSFGVLPSDLFADWLANDYYLDVSAYLEIEDGKYLISNEADFEKLLAFGADSEIAFKLTSDLDLGSTPGFYIPCLRADFDGDHHCIANLNVTELQNNDLGMFGVINGAEVSNLGITNVELNGYLGIGGLGGRLDSTEIINCYSWGEVEGILYTGGLFGVIGESSTVVESFSSSSVTSEIAAGGFAGVLYVGVINNCYALGDVAGQSGSGGLVGFMESATITDSYAAGSVSDGDGNGGFAGEIRGGSIVNSIWNVESSGQEEGVGDNMGTIDNLQGMTSAEMRLRENYLDMGWDFAGEEANGTEDLWDMDSSLNSGYPFITAIGGDVSEDENVLEAADDLFIYPNPFNPVTNIYYEVPEAGEVDIAVYNVKGQKVEQLLNEYKPAGKYNIIWDAKKVAGGVYFIRYQQADNEQVRKMTLLK
ncbi:MAG: T9SS type A sorting domain-containing protein [Candidatus Cloacimonetes bacterium]|nr:T9SS type A sorting domain-containing protein [Candidatus Cloacimonadota bacterium]